MWHEARRRERATQKLVTDHKRRAEKRREENRVDPRSLLHVNGVKSKVIIDLTTHKQALNSMVVWQGDQTTTIDRFDVRATLSALPVADKLPSKQADKNNHEMRRKPTILDANENALMKKLLNFERYRLIMQNDLRKIPEATRLSLVDKKHHLLSEAKMRKLKNNWFGTSGESSTVSEQTALKINQPDTRQPGASFSYDYNVGQSENVDDDSSTQIGISQMIPDLDDRETELDLDHVEKIRNNVDGNNVINIYGLNCDEFNLINDLDSSNAKEIILKLKQIRSELESRKPKQVFEATRDQDFYGPALPPDMQKQKSSDDLHRSDNLAPERQRSPGSVSQNETLFRNTFQKISPQPSNEHKPSMGQREDNPPKTILERGSQEQPSIVEKSSQDTRISVQASTVYSNESSSQKHSTSKYGTREVAQNRLPPVKINLASETSFLKSTETKNDISGDELNRKRRAVTPLAYKRYRRSSRSISRDREPHGRNHARSSSSCSSSGSTQSRSSQSSLTNSSYYERSHSTSRRRRGRRQRSRTRSRSRSPRYNDSRKNRHRYRQRERR